METGSQLKSSPSRRISLPQFLKGGLPCQSRFIVTSRGWATGCLTIHST
jgi:hypothetical protein